MLECARGSPSVCKFLMPNLANRRDTSEWFHQPSFNEFCLYCKSLYYANQWLHDNRNPVSAHIHAQAARHSMDSADWYADNLKTLLTDPRFREWKEIALLGLVRIFEMSTANNSNAEANHDSGSEVTSEVIVK